MVESFTEARPGLLENHDLCVEDEPFHLELLHLFGLLGQRLVELIHLSFRRGNQLRILFLGLLFQYVELFFQLVVIHDKVRNGSLSVL